MFSHGSRTFSVITGASRGFGRALAIALAKEFSKCRVNGQIAVLARSAEGLASLQSSIHKECPDIKGNNVKFLEVWGFYLTNAW